MVRYRLDMSYVGTQYHGWQRQENAASVQGCLEDALRRVSGLSLEAVGAGRTDTGVHAERYVAHTDFPEEIDPASLKKKLNAVLPRDIAVHAVSPVPNSFHARFSASRRTYEYRIAREKLPFLVDTSFLYTAPLDLEAMQRAAAQLIGEREFGCFCKTGGNSNSMRCHIFESHWRTEGPLLIYKICADRFLRNMVRAIVGTLLDIGRGKRNDNLDSLLASGNRGHAGDSVPGHGLFLINVEY